MKKYYHKKYGFGVIIEDVEGLCDINEVCFKPDDGIFDRCDPTLEGKKALWVPAKFDIFNINELT